MPSSISGSHPEILEGIQSQELYTFQTPDGLYQPTRVPMGCVDAVAYAQSTMHEVHGDLMPRHVTAWIDDVVGYAADEAEMLPVLEQAFARYAQYGMKLNPSKGEYFTKEVTWCGRVISASGITHDPERIQGLVDLTAPTTAGDLQQFLGAVGWMRSNIPEFAKLTEPLRACLERACTLAGARTKKNCTPSSLPRPTGEMIKPKLFGKSRTRWCIWCPFAIRTRLNPFVCLLTLRTNIGQQ